MLDDYYGSSSPGVRAGCVGDAAVDDNLLEDLGAGRNSRDSLRSLSGLAGAA